MAEYKTIQVKPSTYKKAAAIVAKYKEGEKAEDSLVRVLKKAVDKLYDEVFPDKW